MFKRISLKYIDLVNQSKMANYGTNNRVIWAQSYKDIFSVKLCYDHFKHSDWLLKNFKSALK